MTINKALFSSASDEWSTPQDLFDVLNKEFNFTLDACASDTNHKCDKYFTQQTDGLSQKWEGVVWVNPPYSDIKAWIKKAYEESQQGYCEKVVLLIPARTDTKIWHEYCQLGTDIRFIKGRLKFGDAKNCAPFPSAIIVFSNPDSDEYIYGGFSHSRIKFWDWRQTESLMDEEIATTG